MVQKYYGAASRAAVREIGGICQPKEAVVAVGVASALALAYNPDRIALLITNIGTTNITLARGTPVVSGQGVLLLGNGSTISLNWRDDADAVAFQWYAISDLAGGSLFIEETVQAFDTPESEVS